MVLIVLTANFLRWLAISPFLTLLAAAEQKSFTTNSAINQEAGPEIRTGWSFNSLKSEINLLLSLLLPGELFLCSKVFLRTNVHGGKDVPVL
jgi:hypothetical protein